MNKLRITFIKDESFKLNGEQIDRRLMIINEHRVALVVYDKSPIIAVMIDQVIKLMHFTKAENFVRNYL